MEYTPEELEAIYRLLKNCDFEPRSYSGRGMYGKTCLGVAIDRGHSMFDLGWYFGDAGIEMPTPRHDTLGLGSILYWPHIPAPTQEQENATAE